MLLGVYVDDLIIISKSLEDINLVKALLSKRFKMQDFGEAKSILKIRIQRDKLTGVLSLDQAKYSATILKRFGMENCHGSAIPLCSTTHFSNEQCPSAGEDKELMSKTPYRQAIGSLMYLMVSTRPDLAYPVQILSRYGSNPGPAHWKAVKKVFQYVQETMHFGIIYKRGTENKLTG